MQTAQCVSEVDLDQDADKDTGSLTDLRLICRKGRQGILLWILGQKKKKKDQNRGESFWLREVRLFGKAHTMDLLDWHEWGG